MRNNRIGSYVFLNLTLPEWTHRSLPPESARRSAIGTLGQSRRFDRTVVAGGTSGVGANTGSAEVRALPTPLPQSANGCAGTKEP